MQEESTVKDFKFYYKYLIRTFGHADCTGCRALAHVLTTYKPGNHIQDIYKAYAEVSGSTPSAVERSVRVYLNCITKDYSMEDIRKNVFQEAQTLSKEILTNPEIRKVMGEGQYYQIKTQNGFKNEDVTKAIQQYITGENLNANPALITLLEKNLNQFR